MEIFNIVKESISFENVCRDNGIEFNRNKKALCPFHSEKTPSFHKFSTHAFCFGCGKTADAIDIEAHHTGLTPFEAALSLAKKYRIQLPSYSPKDKEKFNNQVEAYKLLEKLARYANKKVKKHPEVLEFLKGKGLEIEDIDHYLIGWVENENLVTRNLKNEPEVKLAKEIGLIHEHGDYFRNRIIFPVWNYGKIIYLTGRAYPDNLINENNPKYLHLKNTSLVYKQLAFPENLRKEKCLITEGITDAIAFLRADVPACASLGTNLGKHETESLLKTKSELYFCFDNDEAGNTASYKLAREFQGYVVNLDSNKDCDELLAEKGIDEFKKVVEKAIENAENYLDLVIEKEDKIEVLREISKLEYESDKDIWLNKLKNNHKVSEKSLRKDLDFIKTEERKKAAQSSGDGETLRQEAIDLLADSRPFLHPSMSLIGGKLAYGIKRGGAFVIYFQSRDY